MAGIRDENGQSPVRIAIVVPTHWDYLMGGSQYQAKLLIRQLHSSGKCEIVYFAARIGPTRDYPDHRVVAVGKAGILRRYGNFWDYFRLKKALSEFRPDVIYQRVACAHTGICAGYARRSGTPFIWHVANERDCQPKPPFRALATRPHACIENHLTVRGMNNADHIIAQTNDQKRLLRINYGLEVDDVISNFHQKARPFQKPAKPMRVVWIANLKPSKRPELFLDIVERLGDMDNVEFCMVGAPYATKSLMEYFQKRLASCPGVQYMGALPQTDVESLLEKSHLLVNTSVVEGFSNTFIQAWMRSVPVLTMGVNPDGLLDSGPLGRSFANAKDMADSIRGFADDTDSLLQMRDGARSCAESMFSMSNARDLAGFILTVADQRMAASDKTRRA